MYRTGVEYGDYTINHLLGCAHGCRYPCYAMMMARRYGRVAGYEDWLHPRLVGNALELLDRELPRLRGKIRFVHLSFTTDPFMYDPVNHRVIPWVRDMTLAIIERLNRAGVRVTTLTKGLYPPSLSDERYAADNEYGVSVVSLDKGFVDRYEPLSAPPQDRISSLRRLSGLGLKTWVSIEPYPTPNIVQQRLTDLLEQVSFVDKIIFGRWNYNRLVREYPNSSAFYSRCVETVLEFSKSHGILVHIKEGTPAPSRPGGCIFE